MEAVDTYKSIESASQGLFKDRGSRFIAYAYPVSSADRVKQLVDALKKEHHAARHHCYAYRIGPDGGQWRASDDGEPSGTAGRPVLGAIDSRGLSDVLVVVVRYFGGILLGASGLARAYREAAEDALAGAGVIVKTATAGYELKFGYAEMDDVQRIVKDFADLAVRDRNFGMECSMTVDVPLGKTLMFENLFIKNNNEKGTCIQCRPLQIAPAGN